MILDKDNYPEEKELDTNASLTLAQTLRSPLVSVIWAISVPVVVTAPLFSILRIWIHHTIGGGIQSPEIDFRRKIKMCFHDGN